MRATSFLFTCFIGLMVCVSSQDMFWGPARTKELNEDMYTEANCNINPDLYSFFLQADDLETDYNRCLIYKDDFADTCPTGCYNLFTMGCATQA